MYKNLALGFTGLIIFAGAFFLLSNQQSKNKSEETQMAGKENIDRGGYKGKVLTGKQTPYIDFNKADYDKALNEGKIVFLNFYANWCPICRAETPDINSGFDSLNTDQVVGFRVNYNDIETDDDEKALAKQFAITYQHTKVILKNGQEVLKKTEQWDEQTLVSEINKVL